METVQANQRVISVFHILKITYGLVPIVAGLDKFTNLLTDWEHYLHPAITSMLPFSPHTFMMIVGIVEIAAGLLVFLKPHIGGYVVMAWLVLIALSLIATRQYLDVAVRDLVMAIGAYSFAQIARVSVAPKEPQTHGAVAFP